MTASTKALAIVSYSLLAAIFIFFFVGQVAIGKEMRSVLPKPTPTERWTPNKWVGTIGVQRDADWEAMQQIAQENGYSQGENGEYKYRQPDDTTGYPALDKVLRFLWNNCGILIVVFGLLAGISILASRMEHGETHNERMRRETEELESPGLSEDIHAPFDAPQGMQPSSQYVSIRTRQ